MEQADVLFVESPALTEELLERVLSESAVARVVGALAVVVFVRYPMRVEGLSALRV